MKKIIETKINKHKQNGDISSVIHWVMLLERYLQIKKNKRVQKKIETADKIEHLFDNRIDRYYNLLT